MGAADLAPAIEKIPMKDMEQCQLQGSLLKSTKEMNAINIAAILAANFNPSVAPLLKASIALIFVCSISQVQSKIHIYTQGLVVFV